MNRKAYSQDEFYLLNLISIFKNIKDKIENDDRFLFLDEINNKYNLIAYIELLKVLTDEFKYDEIIKLNYLRTHDSLNNNIYLQSKWGTYCQYLTSKLISYDILVKERQGIYKLKI